MYAQRIGSRNTLTCPVELPYGGLVKERKPAAQQANDWGFSGVMLRGRAT
jgi:hypothetical protein